MSDDPWSKKPSQPPLMGERFRKPWRKAQPDVCHYCGKRLKKSEKTVDHKSPHCKDVPDTPENWVVACEPCNRDKGTMTYEQYALSLKLRRMAVPTAPTRESDHP